MTESTPSLPPGHPPADAGTTAPSLPGSVTVAPGEVIVEYVDLIFSGRDCLVYEIGTKTKYPQCLGYGEHDILLSARPESLHLDGQHKDKATMVILPKPGDGWDALPQTYGRYSLRVVFYRRHDGERQSAWTLPDPDPEPDPEPEPGDEQ